MSSLLGLLCTYTLFLVLAATFKDSVMAKSVKQFKVGDDFGWREPDPTNADVYSLWAAKNRFQVGDSLCFEYKNDSVLVVEKWNYYHCDTSDLIFAFDNGKSVIKLDRSGFFYFISGASGHCKNGQRLLVDVISEGSPGPSPFSASAPLICSLSVALFAAFAAVFVLCAP